MFTEVATAIWFEACYQDRQADAPWQAWSQTRSAWFHEGECYDRHSNTIYSPALACLDYAFAVGTQP